MTATVETDPFAPEVLHAPRAGAAPVLLALDLGTLTGWALEQAGVVTSGVQSFRPGRYDGGGMRYLRFRRWLDEMRGETNIVTIAFEEVRRHMGVDAAHVYGGLMGTLTAWCEQHTIPYEGIPVGTIKKFATGKGNADKAAMIAYARANGHLTDDDNEADAVALLNFIRNRDK